jgi:hypothetical protein
LKKNENLSLEQLKSLFICDICGCIEQVRTGYYPEYHEILIFDNDDLSLSFKCMCSACVPKRLWDKSSSGFSGTWHNKFPKKTWEKWGYPDVINKD